MTASSCTASDHSASPHQVRAMMETTAWSHTECPPIWCLSWGRPMTIIAARLCTCAVNSLWSNPIPVPYGAYHGQQPSRGDAAGHPPSRQCQWLRYVRLDHGVHVWLGAIERAPWLHHAATGWSTHGAHHGYDHALAPYSAAWLADGRQPRDKFPTCSTAAFPTADDSFPAVGDSSGSSD